LGAKVQYKAPIVRGAAVKSFVPRKQLALHAVIQVFEVAGEGVFETAYFTSNEVKLVSGIEVKMIVFIPVITVLKYIYVS
jgi:hypothetical protein